MVFCFVSWSEEQCFFYYSSTKLWSTKPCWNLRSHWGRGLEKQLGLLSLEKFSIRKQYASRKNLPWRVPQFLNLKIICLILVCFFLFLNCDKTKVFTTTIKSAGLTARNKTSLGVPKAEAVSLSVMLPRFTPVTNVKLPRKKLNEIMEIHIWKLKGSK